MKVTALGVLCCFALFVCLTLLASFFLPSHLSFKNMYIYTCPVHVYSSSHDRYILYVHYVDYHDGKSLLNPEDLRSGLVGPYDEGAQGVVIWGSSTEINNTKFLSVRSCSIIELSSIPFTLELSSIPLTLELSVSRLH